MLKKRIITAIILLALLMGIIFYSSLGVFKFVLFCLIAVGAWEWTSLIDLPTQSYRVFYTLSVLVLLLITPHIPLLFLLMVGLLVWLWFAAAIYAYQINNTHAGIYTALCRPLVGYLIFCTSYLALMLLRESILFGPKWLLYFLCIVWATDVGAYFSGKLWGQKQFVSKVSPNKTWVGFFGGLLLAFVVALIGSLWIQLDPLHSISLLIISVITALFSVIGDLGMSLIKRLANKKDTGFIFPGHGGVLDRCDSVFSASVVFVLLMLMMRI